MTREVIYKGEVYEVRAEARSISNGRGVDLVLRSGDKVVVVPAGKCRSITKR